MDLRPRPRGKSPNKSGGDVPKVESARADSNTGPIAVIAPCPFPANHGTPGSIREIVNLQAERGLEIHVFTFPIHDELPISPKLTVHRVSMLGKRRRIKVGPVWQRPFWDLMIVWKLCIAARRHRYRLIHAYNYEGGLFGGLARLWLRRPLVLHHFNTMIDELPSYGFIRPRFLAVWLAKFLDYWVPRLATHIIAISRPVMEFLESKGIARNKITEIPMGIDPAIFKNRIGNSIRAEYDLADTPLVVYTGLINQFQRVDYLLEAMQLVVSQREDARLMLVINYAQPEDLTCCRDIIDGLRLSEHVIITRPEPFERVPDYLAAADVCALSRPNCPGVPIKLLNYMASGKAIVVPQGSSMDLTHNVDAYVVADDDVEDLARGILAVLSDKDLGKRLGKRAEQTLDEQYSLAAICRRIDKVYSEVTNVHSKPHAN